MIEKTCCCFGHRDTQDTPELRNKLNSIIENLIIKEKVNVFLFGSRSRFNDICYDEVTKLRKKHPDIKRVYVRAEYPYIDEEYRNYLLKKYEDTYFPERIRNAHMAVYVERNCEMIDKSRFCVIYFSEDNKMSKGTKTALDYAIKRKKKIIVV